MNPAAEPDRWIPQRGAAAIAAVVVLILLALDASDAAARAKARLTYAAQRWWRGVERRQRDTLLRRTVARLLRASSPAKGTR